MLSRVLWKERPPEPRSHHVVLLLLFVLCCHTGAQNESAQGKICPSMDIRNSVASFKYLEGCHVVEGFVQILLFDNTKETDFENVTFPELREITCYLLAFRVRGLKSLGQLFPNLAVIRGNQLFNDYALVIYEMFHLTDIGLMGLTTIERGDVRIEKNAKLCFVDTIDWTRIIQSGSLVNVKNKDTVVCPSRVCKGCEEDLCWGSERCQKLHNDDCHQMCLGGCTGPGPRNCSVCKHVLSDGECVDSCPPNSYTYLGRRCVTDAQCRAMRDHHKIPKINVSTDHKLSTEEITPNWWTYNNTCIQQCPSGYEEKHDVNGTITCVPCIGECRQECKGSVVNSIAAAQNLRGCTVINGSLEIQILRGQNIYKELESSMNMIEEIYGYLKVARSFPLISLNFLKKLRIIHGTADLDNGKYALVVINNQNLQELWNWTSRPEPKFQIKKGRIFFHFNPNLCHSHIDTFARYAGLSNYTNLEVARESNGDKVACNVVKMNTNVSIKGSRFVVITWEPCAVPDPSSLLGYIVYYIEAPTRNMTASDGREACGNNGWNMKDVSILDDPEDNHNNNNNNNNKEMKIDHILTHLEPFTQYAFYILTYSVTTTGGQSPIEYFTTLPDRPSQPRDFSGTSNTSSEIHLEWKPPLNPNGILSHYNVSGIRLVDDKQFLAHRDYCVNPLAYRDDGEDSSSLQPSTTTHSIQTNSSDECKMQQRPKTIENKEEYDEFCQGFTPGHRVRRGNSNWDEACEEYIYTLFHSILPNQKSMYSNDDKENEKFPQTVSQSLPTWGHSLTDTIMNEGGYEQYHQIINANETSLVLKDLHYFSKYNIQLIACRQQYDGEENSSTKKDTTQCSFSSLITLRTRPHPSADLINSSYVTVEILNHTAGEVRLQWKEPHAPNGLIVSYTVEFRKTDNEHFIPVLECITRKQYEMGEGGYILQNLQPGKYGFRIRANSLAALGPFSDMVHMVIEEDVGDVPPQVVIGVVLGVIMILGCIIIFIFFWKKYHATKIMRLFATVNPDYIGSLGSAYVEDEWEVPRERLHLLRELGQGSFGMVYEGILRPTKIRCAVKMVNENASMRERMEFLNEASVMKSFAGAHHVVRLLGVVSRGQPPLVIMELMARGDLKSFLRAARDSPSERPGLPRVLRMAAEIADGMAYLEASKFVHRDLAARNCMVAEDLTVKIGDFGMTRDIYETDYYRNGSKGLLPVRWMAPESLADGVFSSQSDVWSYGVVLWEMATLAEQPYQGLANEQVLQFVLAAGLLERPLACPDFLHDMMLTCWQWRPSERPTFLQLLAKLENTAKLSPLFRKLSFFHSSLAQEMKANHKPDSRIFVAACPPHVTFYHSEDGQDLSVRWTRQPTSSEEEEESLLQDNYPSPHIRQSRNRESLLNDQNEYVESNTVYQDKKSDTESSPKIVLSNGDANGYIRRSLSS